MQIFKKYKSAQKKREVSRVQKRLQLLPDRDIVAWAESSIYEIARNISSWQKNNERFYIDEAALSAEVLYEALQLIKQRTDA